MLTELGCDFEVNPNIGIYFCRMMLMLKLEKFIYRNFYLQHARPCLTIQSTNLKVRHEMVCIKKSCQTTFNNLSIDYFFLYSNQLSWGYKVESTKKVFVFTFDGYVTS